MNAMNTNNPSDLFAALDRVPDHPAIEHEVLAWWEEQDVFGQLRQQNAGRHAWSFIDGPITANNPMGVHHCWGRSLKDAFQRYKAMRGYDLRYQNGFDCQGLHVEVGVEQSLGLNSKRDIEAYGLAEFALRCRERVTEFAEIITNQSRRLGMWMDWENSYYTFSDTNIEYIWRFLKQVHQRGWLYLGHRATEWCPRCGTSISQHELKGPDAYAQIEHPSLEVRFPIRDGNGESLVAWTTTPWTLPANVALAVNPDAEYGLRGQDWVAVSSDPDAEFSRRVTGSELVGRFYDPPFPELAAQDGVEHRVIPWDEVSLTEGTGVVHIAPGAGGEDFELARLHGLPVLAPVDEDGRFVEGYGAFVGRTTEEVREVVIGELEARGRLVSAGTITHRYPVCWRCATPLIFRVADDWFISADEIRKPMLEANASVEWTPPFYSKRMDDWLHNMGDWNISRRRYFGLPLPFYPCRDCGTIEVIGSLDELRERALGGLEQLQELHRPWIDEVTIACNGCGGELRRIPEVGDAWLDAGIVPFSTLGWNNPKLVPGGYATGASAEISGADLPDHANWQEWFPAAWVSEMREQIRLWFYSQLFMSVALVGEAPYRRVLTYEKLRDSTGREMHKSWGNAIEANEAMERMGADVMRFMFAEHPPHLDMNFGYGSADDVKRRLLTLWNSVKFFVDYARIEGFLPRLADLDAGPIDAQLLQLDIWLLARTREFVAAATNAYDRFATPDVTREFESFVDDLSNWYIRRTRRRFYEYDEAAFRTLWFAIVQTIRVIAPIMPFFADRLWQTLVSNPCSGAPISVFLAGWPQVDSETEEGGLLAEVTEVRRVIELGRQARAQSQLKLRQPLRRMVIQGAELVGPYAGEIADELRVKEVIFGPVVTTGMSVKPNLPKLGPRIGKRLPEVREALARGEFERIGENIFRVVGLDLTADEVLVEQRAPEGWVVAGDDLVTVALTTELDDELLLEGRLLNLLHTVNVLRRESGFEITTRIELTIPTGESDLLVFEDRIASETLATSIVVGKVLGVERAAGAAETPRT
jgi:isoleucyl-tRNA synthetase